MLRDELKDFFACEGIELYEILPFADCRVINDTLLSGSVPQAKSVILYAAPYFNGIPEKRNLSLYALSKDYHRYIKGLNGRLIAFLSERLPGRTFVGFGDRSPIDERHAAARAGLGVRGDNGLLITEKYGSYVFLGEVLTDVPPEAFPAAEAREIGECLHCGACLAACPCAMDRCASGVSQKKGELTAEEEALVLKTGLIWGCDLCQTCCPLNETAARSPISFFTEERLAVLDEETLENMDKQTFRARAFAWHGKGPLRRNLALYEKEKK